MGRLAARLYDRQLSLERPALRAALALARPEPSDHLLDVATGTGALLRELATRSERPARAVGIDASGSMLARVGGLPGGWTLRRADASALPFADQSFDLVTAVYLLHTLDPVTRATVSGELRRVVREGGRVVTVTVATPRPRLRRLMSRVPRRHGLCPLDPSRELEGLVVREARYVRRGYPSLCLRAERPPR